MLSSKAPLYFSTLVALSFLQNLAHADKREDAEIDAIQETIAATTQTKRNEAEAAKPEATPERREELKADTAKQDAKVEGLSGRFPASAGVQTAAAEHWLSRGSLERAGSSVERALAAPKPDGDPRLTAKALAIRGMIAFAKGGYEAAYRDGAAAHKFDPDNRAAFELMKYAESALALRGRLPEDLVKEQFERLRTLSEQGPARDVEAWSERQREHPTMAGRWVAKAGAARREGNLGLALQHAEKAVAADPNDPMARFQRGWTRAELGDQSGATLDLSRAISLGWVEPVLFKLRAEALLFAGHHQAAIADANMAIVYDPKMAAPYATRAMARMKLHIRDSEALAAAGPEIFRDLETAARLDPSAAKMLADAREIVASAERTLKERGQAGGPLGSAAAVPPAPRPGTRSRGESALAVALALASCLAAVWIIGRRRRGPAVGASPAPAADAGAASPLRPELQVKDRYRLGRELGRGGMGIVYEGEDKSLGRRVAIKKIGGAPGAAELDDILNEARIAAMLKHDAIVDIYDILPLDGALCIVFEFVAGRTLHDRLKEGRMAPAEVLKVMTRACSALDYAHSMKVIHRDIKPSNIMLDDAGGVKIMDFGVARRIRGPGPSTLTSQIAGTPGYMAPEQYFGHVSPKSDLYALAATAYEMLTGARPFATASLKDLQADALAGRMAPASVFVTGAPDIYGVIIRLRDKFPIDI